MIEIAVFRFDGQEVVDQLISLVHPHRKVQAFVQKMTGITPNMLARAPRFHELAKRLVDITEDAVIVGHNVEFDYRMLRQEFERLGYAFERATLDTIALAEKLLPDLRSYGLDTVCEELGIYRRDRHRAEDDARATLELFQILSSKDGKQEIGVMGQSIQENKAFKDKLADLQRAMRYNQGVYYLHDRKGKLLYLGASDNIKSALNRLFLNDQPQALKLRERVHSVRVEPAGNWLSARLKHREDWRETKPPFNRLPRDRFTHTISVDKRQDPPAFRVEGSPDGAGFLRFNSAKAAWRALRMHRRNLSAERQQKVLDILEHFPTTAYYLGSGRKGGEKCLFQVQDGQLAAYGYLKLHDELEHPERLRHRQVQVPPNPVYTEYLRQGIFSGEFVFWEHPGEES